MSLFAAFYVAIVLGSLLTFGGWAVLLGALGITPDLLPVAVGSAVAVGLLTIFGVIAPENR
jgi:hypothetical protein